MARQRVVVVGATGMVGGEVLALCLASPEVEQATAIGRRAPEPRHDKLDWLRHGDFSDCTALEPALRACDVAFFCLGAYTGAVPDAEFRRVTVDFPARFAQALARANPAAAPCFLGAHGSDVTESSRIPFARYKGAAENALRRAGLARVHLLRPNYIRPSVPRREPNALYVLARWLYPLVRLVKPNSVVTSRALARAMFELGLHGRAGEREVVENAEIRALAARLGESL